MTEIEFKAYFIPELLRRLDAFRRHEGEEPELETVVDELVRDVRATLGEVARAFEEATKPASNRE